jgi:very-short-patch-repair endonuclease
VSRRSKGADRVEDYINAAAQHEALRFVEYFDTLRERCESPIEVLLCAALYGWSKIDDLHIDFLPGADEVRSEPYSDEAIFVYQQIQMGPYRADFVIHDVSVPLEIQGPRIIIVECDGHDFHERTKEQARRDKKRDRYFQSKGYKVLRFTGSEIWADPDTCVEEIIDQLACNEWRNLDK